MQCTFKVFFTCSMCIARYLRWVQDHTKITPKLIRNQIVTTKRLGTLTTFSKFKWGGLVRGKRGEQRLKLSPFPCRIGYDVWSSTVHTVMQRNVTGTWNFVKKLLILASAILWNYHHYLAATQAKVHPRGGYSTKFYMGRLRPEDQPRSLLYTIFDRKGPFLLTNGTPFTYLV